MSQSTAPQKRSLSPGTQDSAPSVEKKQRLADEVHVQSDRDMNSADKKRSITHIIHKLWFTVTEAELSSEHSQSLSVFQKLQEAKYLEQTELRDIIDRCIASGTWKELREHGLKFLESVKEDPVKEGPSSVTDVEGPPSVTGSEATERSWGVEYRGLAYKALEEIIIFYAQLDDHERDSFYAQAIPIVQSSGTGKSRMIDELAKKLVVIPLNLRPSPHTGFPPCDEEVKSYFDIKGTYKVMMSRCLSFLSAVFTCTKEILENIDNEIRKIPEHDSSHLNSLAAAKFRFLMTAGSSYESQGSYRVEFYNKILDMAQSQQIGIDSSKHLLKTKAEELTSCVEDMGYKAVVFACDEVHGLFEPLTDVPKENVFHCLRRALNSINRVKGLVSVFLSTAGEMRKYAPPPYMDPSRRLSEQDFKLIPPFTDIGFDQLVVGKVKKDLHYLRDMVSIEWMSQFGRPLFGTRYNEGGESERNSMVRFAALKLLGGVEVFKMTPTSLSESQRIAILSARISLCFTRTTLTSRTLEVDQVEHHMRLCLAIKHGNETAITIAASEPLLAEGARYIVRELKLNQAGLLKEVLSGPSLDKGDRGEMVALLLFILARDAVVGDGLNMKLTRFLNALLRSDGPSTEVTEDQAERYVTAAHVSNILEGHPMFLHRSDNDVSLERCFEHSEVHFNHFIRIEHASAMNRSTLYGLIARGAAILCRENQPGVDVVIPFVFDARKPVGPDNVSVILCQVRNAFEYTTKVVGNLFDPNMDPFKLGVFNPPDKQPPIPFIRMVMALGSPKSGISILSPQRRNPLRDSKPTDKYTAYDIWCAGACSSTFRVIDPNHNNTYQDLLLSDKPAVYSSEHGSVGSVRIQEAVRKIRKSENPGVRGDDPEHLRYLDEFVTDMLDR